MSFSKTVYYGESARMLTGAISQGRFAADVVECTGDDFGKARDRLVKLCSSPPYDGIFGWALDPRWYKP